MRNKMGWSIVIAVVGLVAAMNFFIVPTVRGQATVSAGGIQGAILDPSGGTVSAATVTVISKATGQRFVPKVNASGEYTAGSLAPGDYTIRVEAAGFKTLEKGAVVQVGLVTPGTVTLELGASSIIVTVEANTAQVNTDQAIVSGVLTTQQIESLPINGRNFLDLAQLEPGVQIQDGSNFDPTKTGFSSISFGGRFGRTARIAVDGVDISDETVGTTTSNIPESALQEFQLSQSSLDLSNDLTSSGSVNVTTRSGTNEIHGQAFGLFRDSTQAAALPHPAGISAPFQRSQFGGNFGGPILKDKLFFFADGERTKQELFVPIVLPDPFTALGSGYATPYRESDLIGKLDYAATQNLKFFYRFNYFANSAVAASSLSPFKNKDYTRTHVLGADWNTGSWTNSVRFEYLKFQNQIVDGTAGLGLPDSNLGVEFLFPNAGLLIGPNFLAPQTTPQSDHQYKYDGSRSFRNHTIRFGANFNHLQGGGFAKFFSLAPRITNTQDAASLAFAANGPFPGGIQNPLNYPVELTFLGNGLGFGSELPSFGFPLGGLGPDNRVGLYLGDSWKIKSNLTLSAGLRWGRDTGRTDSDIATNAAINAAYPGLGNKVRQPNLNFAPQLGIAWDPFKTGKTVIRAGAGIFYENVIWNNVLFDRPLRLPKGGFAFTPNACLGIDQPVAVPFGDGTVHTPPVGACGDGRGNPVAIGSAAPLLVAFQKQFQAAAETNPISNNSAYLPTLIATGSSIAPPSGFFAPNFQTPRALQMNIGFQRQVWKGGILSADFLRNVGTHLSLAVDVNHVGDSRFFNKAAAQAAIAATLNACGVGSVDAAILACPGIHPSANGNPAGPATMADFARRGLGIPNDAGVGACIPAAGVNFQCAFAGQNPNVPSFFVQEPIGRSTYDALQVKFLQNVTNPVIGIRNLSLQVSYSLSSYKNTGGFNGSAPFPSSPAANDLDFVSGSLDSRNPFRYFGPSALDRTHQLSFGGVVDVPGGFRAGVVAHFYSALPDTLYSQNSGNPGEIFRSDFTGDGTVADPLPNTRVGAFGRDVGLAGLRSIINNFNQTVANHPTPAGQVLVDPQNGLFTAQQLVALGGVPGTIALPPADQVPLYGLRAFDLRLSWVHKFRERLTVEPSVSAYNLFNFANFDLPTSSGGLLSGTLSGTPGSLNGTNYAAQGGVRVGSGSGVFGLGAPRVIEWGLKLTF